MRNVVRHVQPHPTASTDSAGAHTAGRRVIGAVAVVMASVLALAGNEQPPGMPIAAWLTNGTRQFSAAIRAGNGESQ